MRANEINSEEWTTKRELKGQCEARCAVMTLEKGYADWFLFPQIRITGTIKGSTILSGATLCLSLGYPPLMVKNNL